MRVCVYISKCTLRVHFKVYSIFIKSILQNFMIIYHVTNYNRVLCVSKKKMYVFHHLEFKSIIKIKIKQVDSVCVHVLFIGNASAI